MGAMKLCWRISQLLRKFIFQILSMGPIPTHISFIMDGNRRYAKKHNRQTSFGHYQGYRTLMLILIYCIEFGIKSVSAYAFSIDNFMRGREEVDSIMSVIKECIDELIKEDSLVHYYKVKVHFSGDLRLLEEPIREAMNRIMACTSNYSNILLVICVAYNSSNEIIHALEESIKTRIIANGDEIDVEEIEKRMYMGIVSDPDMIIRTSGEDRLSNYLLWQSGCTLLYTVRALWPEFGLWHLVSSVINFQRSYSYLERIKTQR